MKIIGLLIALLLIGCSPSRDTYDITFISSPLTSSIIEEDINDWARDLIDLWGDYLGVIDEPIYNSIKGAYIIAFDVTELYLEDISVRSILWPDTKEIHLAVIGPDFYPSPIEWARLLSRHELSHLIVGNILGMWNNKQAHQLFHEVDPSLF